jgi:glucose/mannose-6-phosphate isomerase
MRDLDNPDVIEEVDEHKMLKLLMEFPQQYEKALHLARDFKPNKSFGKIGNIVISGMGGSAIGGDLLRSLFIDKCSVPITVNRNYTIPGFVDDKTLFIAVSYSGNTEETLSAFEKAIERGAQSVALSSGGALKTIADNKGFPHVLVPNHPEFPEKKIQPRCAFGYLFIPPVMLLSKLELISDPSSQIEAAINLLSDTAGEISPEIPAEDNEAKQIAQVVYHKLSVIYASQSYFDIVAMRWKGQFNENSKAMAFHNVIPEMNHNEIVGWGVPRDITRRCVVIFLRDDGGGEVARKISKRMDITRDLIAAEDAHVMSIDAKGESPLAKALYLIYLGDFASYYLALLNSVDPTPIKRIDLFKEMLGK